jgi:hypothetical protein
MAVAHPLCVHLRRIVDLLEEGDSGAAAVLVREMVDGLAGLPQAMAPSDVAETEALLGRYRELGDRLRTRVIGDLNRLGLARRALRYGHSGRSP